MRPDKDQYFLKIAEVVASRVTCLRRSVGCVLVDKRGHILSTGYNGVASGQPHCNEMKMVGTDYEDMGNGVSMPRKMVESYPHACPGAKAKSGTNLDGCQAIHAEMNSITQCKDVWSIHTCYSTVSPCMTCTKLLLSTGCQRIVYKEKYPHGTAETLWVESGRTWDICHV